MSKAAKMVAAIVTTAAAAVFGGPILGAIATVAQLSALDAYTAPKLPTTSTGDESRWKADPRSGVPYCVGRCAIAGDIRFEKSAPVSGSNKFKNFVTIYSVGPIDGFEGFYANNNRVDFTSDQGEGASGYYKNRMWMRTQLGRANEPYLRWTATGTKDTPADHGGLPTEWTPAHRLSGYAASLWGLEFDTNKYAGGVPPPKMVGRWVKVYDPRKDSTYPGGAGPHRYANPSNKAAYLAAKATWEWSADPNLHGLMWGLGTWTGDPDYPDLPLVQTHGLGYDIEDIDVASFVEAANVSRANAWTLGGRVYSTDDKWEVLKSFLQAGGAEPVLLGDRLACVVNSPKVSMATVTGADTAGEVSLDAAVPFNERLNTIWPSWTVEELAWEVTPAGAPVQVAEYVAVDKGERSKEMTLPLVQSGIQAGQLARYMIEDSRELPNIVIPLKPEWMWLEPGECITANEPAWGLNGQKLSIRRRVRDPATMVVTLICRTETDAKHPYALGQSAMPGGGGALTGVDPNVVPVPAEDAWAIVEGVVAGESGSLPAIVIGGAADLYEAVSIVVDYRKVLGGGAYGPWRSESFPASATTLVVKGVEAGARYQVRVRYITARGVENPDDGTDLGEIDTGGVDAGTVQGREIVQDIINLIETYGDTVSAAASAAAADAARGAAQTAAANAATARDQAQAANEEAMWAALDAFDKANAAAGSASAAAGSATSAATKASEAAGSASSASGSANTASIKAGEAASSASSASTSASSAAGSATAAGSSASAAQTAKTAAEVARDAASGSATAAASSASSAAGSATSAGNSASAANTSATNANTSAGQAATSAGNASTSASQASTSASNAAGSASTASTQATLASAAATSATNTAKAQFPAAVTNRDQWTYEQDALVTSGNYPAGRYYTASDGTPVWGSEAAATETLIPTASFTPVPGRRYQVVCRIRRVQNVSNGRPSLIFLGMGYRPSTGFVAPSAGYDATAWPLATWQTVVYEWVAVEAQWARPRVHVNWDNAGTSYSNAKYEVASLVVTDVTSETAAAGSATSAATSASAANTSATNAGVSATSATSSANTASTQAGNASSSATSAGTSAAAASTSAAAAQQNATLAASVGPGALNKNPVFSDYPTASGIPGSWVDWSNGALGTRQGGEVGPYAYEVDVPNTNDQGIQQGNIYGAAGWYVIEADAWLQSGTWSGAGVLFWGATEGGTDRAINFAGDPDNGEAVGAFGPGLRRFRKMVQVTVAETKNLYAMTNFAGVGSAKVAKRIRWYRVAVRPATEGEIKGRRADGNAGSALAQIAAEAATRASETGALTSSVNTHTSQIGGLTSTVTAQAGTLADHTGKLAAYLKWTAAAGSDEAKVEVAAGGGNSIVRLVAKTLSLATAVGGAVFDVLTIVGDVVRFARPIEIVVGGAKLCLGPGFGAGGNLVMWFGPSIAQAQMSKGNATFWLDNAGGAYFGGSIMSGLLSNSATGTDLSVPASLTLGPFGTNGQPITVNWSYVGSREGWRTGNQSASGTYMVGLALYRTIAGQAEALVDTKAISGNFDYLYYDGEFNRTMFRESIAGAFTFTDTAGGVANRTYRVVVTSRVFTTVPGGSSQPDGVVQRYGLVTSEN